MPNSPFRARDRERLSTLRRYNILDTPPEERFDRVARLAKRWFDVAIAAITFLTEDREWFKSSIGLDRTELPRELSFCKEYIEDQLLLDDHSILVVEDATRDPRFADNPLVTGGPGIRFYASAPILSPEGHFLGAICVLGTNPRTPNGNDVDMLTDLAGIVSDELELRAARHHVEEKSRKVEALSRELTEAEENERRRLSELLHDDLQQVLHSARMKIETLSEKSSLSEASAKKIEDVMQQIKGATEITRTLSTRFAPPISQKSLRDAFDWLAMQMQEAYGLSVSVHAQVPMMLSDYALKILLFRLVRELLFNVVKHAETDEAKIFLIKEDGLLRIVVEDNGTGFNPDEKLNSGFGLLHLRERIQNIGGTVDIHSEPGSGTRVVAEVPDSDSGVS